MDVSRCVGESVEDAGRVVDVDNLLHLHLDHGEGHAEENDGSFVEEQIPDAQEYAHVHNACECR